MPKKTCFLIPSFYPLIGGAEKQAYILSHQLVKNGIEVFILTRKVKGTPAFEILDGVPVYRVFAKYHSLFFVVSSLIWLIYNRKKYDIINVHTFDSPAVVACLAKYLLPSKKIFIKVRRSGKNTPLAKFKKSSSGKIRLKIMRKQSTGFVAVTEEAKREVIEAGISEKKVKLIPNGVDVEKYKPISYEQKTQLKEEHGFDNKIIGITVGRLIPRKNIDFLIKLWADVIKLIPQATLIVIGEGKERRKLEYLVKEKDLSNHIILKGSFSEDMVLKFMKLSDFFLLSSKSEGVSNAMLEAMSCALPVIAFRIGGTEELIENGKNGFLCDVENFNTYKRSIENLCMDKNLRENLGFEARKKIIQRYSIENISEKYIKMYEYVQR